MGKLLRNLFVVVFTTAFLSVSVNAFADVEVTESNDYFADVGDCADRWIQSFEWGSEVKANASLSTWVDSATVCSKTTGANFARLGIALFWQRDNPSTQAIDFEDCFDAGSLTTYQTNDVQLPATPSITGASLCTMQGNTVFVGTDARVRLRMQWRVCHDLISNCGSGWRNFYGNEKIVPE